MSDFIVNSEAALRIGIFAGLLLTLLIAESLWPRKATVVAQTKRRISNLALVIINSVCVRLAFPVVAVGAAALAQSRGVGTFNVMNWPVWAEVIFCIIILDMMIYWQHVASHKIPLLWALHKVHHADRDIDVTTGSRFHPIEIGLSMAYKMALVVLLGAPVLAVIIFEIILSACATFNHSNINISRAADRRLRRILVTPDMHRVHHSANPEETDRNFGFSVPLWDHIFRSYKAQPDAGHDAMTIGLREHQTPEPSSLLWSLWLPFRGS